MNTSSITQPLAHRRSTREQIPSTAAVRGRRVSAMAPLQRALVGVVGLLWVSALVLAHARSTALVHPTRTARARDGPGLLLLKGGAMLSLRLSGGHEYDDEYEGGGGVSVAEIAKEAASKKAGGAVTAASSAGGAQLSAEAFRKTHDITIRKLGDRAPGGCTQLEPVQSFGKAPFTPEILKAIRAAGFTSPSPIQAQCWPYLAAKHDLVAVAKTGSGKTCGYLLPAFMRILKACPELEMMRRGARTPASGRDMPREPIALVLAPTRELVVQIAAESEKFGRGCNIETLGVYGGVPKGMQMRKLNMGVQVLVATPGRLNDLIQCRSARLNKIVYMVLDEADRMLDMGFEPQIKDIFKECPPAPMRHTVMYSATWPRNVQVRACLCVCAQFTVSVLGWSACRVGAMWAIGCERVCT